jgi:hypothetical protein
VTPVIYLYMELFQEWVLDRFKFLRSPEGEDGAGAVRPIGGGIPVAALAVVGEGNGNGNGNGHENGHH